MIPDAKNIGNATGIECAPDLRRAGDALEQSGLIDRLVLRRAGQDRIVAMQDGFDVDVRPILGVVGVITHPFAKRSFRPGLARNSFAFDRDFAIGGDLKAGEGFAHDVERFAAQTVCDVIFTDFRQRARRQHKQQRILSTQDQESGMERPDMSS